MKEVRGCMENPFDEVLTPLRGKKCPFMVYFVSVYGVFFDDAHLIVCVDTRSLDYDMLTKLALTVVSSFLNSAPGRGRQECRLVVQGEIRTIVCTINDNVLLNTLGNILLVGMN